MRKKSSKKAPRQREPRRKTVQMAGGEIFANLDDVTPIVEFLASTHVVGSKSEATRLIRSGGIYVNNERITDEKFRLTPDRAIEGQLFLVRKGKKDNHLVRIVR